MAVWPYFMLRKEPLQFYSENGIKRQLSAKDTTIVFSILLGIAIIMGFWVNALMEQYPINIKHSDIIPFIEQVYLKRVDLAEPIYAEVDGYGYGKGI